MSDFIINLRMRNPTDRPSENFCGQQNQMPVSSSEKNDASSDPAEQGHVVVSNDKSDEMMARFNDMNESMDEIKAAMQGLRVDVDQVKAALPPPESEIPTPTPNSPIVQEVEKQMESVMGKDDIGSKEKDEDSEYFDALEHQDGTPGTPPHVIAIREKWEDAVDFSECHRTLDEMKEQREFIDALLADIKYYHGII